jgi:hypothetical protein
MVEKSAWPCGYYRGGPSSLDYGTTAELYCQAGGVCVCRQ